MAGSNGAKRGGSNGGGGSGAGVTAARVENAVNYEISAADFTNLSAKEKTPYLESMPIGTEIKVSVTDYAFKSEIKSTRTYTKISYGKDDTAWIRGNDASVGIDSESLASEITNYQHTRIKVTKIIYK